MRDFFQPGRSPVAGTECAVASSHPLASATAIGILNSGGNAIDAAIAATFVLCVVEPQSTGIGGDCFALIAKRGLTPPIGYNGSGRSPKAMPTSGFTRANAGGDRLADTDVHTVTVPGLVEGAVRLLSDHGTLPLQEVLEPAIRYAERGFPVLQKVAAEWRGAEAKLAADEGARRIYLPGGRAPLLGEVFRSEALAATLRAIGMGGSQAFYSGRTGQRLAGFLRGRGSYHDTSDFADHRGAYVEPVVGTYHGVQVWEIPPNGAGVTALLLLSLLEAVGIGREDPRSARYHHLLASATGIAMAARDTYVGDPHCGPIDISPFLDRPHAAKLAANIDVNFPRDQLQSSAARGDTAYVSVVDKERNAVSLISSLFENFGCGIVDAETGVVFHCRGAGFRLSQGHPNSIGPGKRPLHTILPGMVSRDGRVVVSFGVTGGPFQPVGQSRVISAIRDRGLDIQAAIDEPRSFLRDGTLLLEPALADLADTLTAAGHNVAIAADPIGGAHGIEINWASGVLTAGSDPRKDGCGIAT